MSLLDPIHEKNVHIITSSNKVRGVKAKRITDGKEYVFDSCSSFIRHVMNENNINERRKASLRPLLDHHIFRNHPFYGYRVELYETSKVNGHKQDYPTLQKGRNEKRNKATEVYVLDHDTKLFETWSSITNVFKVKLGYVPKAHLPDTCAMKLSDGTQKVDKNKPITIKDDCTIFFSKKQIERYMEKSYELYCDGKLTIKTDIWKDILDHFPTIDNMTLLNRMSNKLPFEERGKVYEIKLLKYLNPKITNGELVEGIQFAKIHKTQPRKNPNKTKIDKKIKVQKKELKKKPQEKLPKTVYAYQFAAEITMEYNTVTDFIRNAGIRDSRKYRIKQMNKNEPFEFIYSNGQGGMLFFSKKQHDDYLKTRKGKFKQKAVYAYNCTTKTTKKYNTFTQFKQESDCINHINFRLKIINNKHPYKFTYSNGDEGILFFSKKQLETHIEKLYWIKQNGKFKKLFRKWSDVRNHYSDIENMRLLNYVSNGKELPTGEKIVAVAQVKL